MTVERLLDVFVSRLLESARRRWPDDVCTIYVVELGDPLGRLLLTTLQALGLVSPPLGKSVSPEGRSVAFAGSLRSADLLLALQGLIEADACFAIEGEPPLAEGAAEIESAIVSALASRETTLLVLGRGVREVLTLVAEPTDRPGGLFGGAVEVGLA